MRGLPPCCSRTHSDAAVGQLPIVTNTSGHGGASLEDRSGSMDSGLNLRGPLCSRVAPPGGITYFVSNGIPIASAMANVCFVSPTRSETITHAARSIVSANGKTRAPRMLTTAPVELLGSPRAL